MLFLMHNPIINLFFVFKEEHRFFSTILSCKLVQYEPEKIGCGWIYKDDITEPEMLLFWLFFSNWLHGQL